MEQTLFGFGLGVLASVVQWYILAHYLVPSIEFFPKIYKSRTDETPPGYQYRIRFSNVGRREILDLELFAKLRVLGLTPGRPEVWRAIYIPVDDARIPRIPSHRGTGKRLAVQLLLSDIPANVMSAWPSDLQEAHKNGHLTLEQLAGVGKDRTFEMIAFGYDSFSGARKVAQSKRYGLDDIVTE